MEDSKMFELEVVDFDVHHGRDFVCFQGIAPIMYAAQTGKVQALEALVELKADVNFIGSTVFSTPLSPPLAFSQFHTFRASVSLIGPPTMARRSASVL